MKKVLITLSVIILAFACKEEKKETPKGEETVITTGVVVIDLGTNYYATVSLKRTIKDSLKLTIIDSSGGKITQEKKVVRDTSYIAWWGQPILDSLNRPMKSKLNPQLDSVKYAWYPVKRESVIYDYNQKWKEN